MPTYIYINRKINPKSNRNFSKRATLSYKLKHTRQPIKIYIFLSDENNIIFLFFSFFISAYAHNVTLCIPYRQYAKFLRFQFVSEYHLHVLYLWLKFSTAESTYLLLVQSHINIIKCFTGLDWISSLSILSLLTC